MVMKWYGITIIFYFLIAGLASWGYVQKKQFNYPSETFFDTFGLDVSHHQGEIKWGQVDSEKYKFVYIKATEGESFKDKHFLKNYAQAKKNNLIVGGYHFWTFCKTAEEQIANFKDSIPHMEEDLVPAVDMESAYSCGVEKAPERVISDMQKINEAVLKTYGRLPVIYTTKEFASVHPEIFNFPNIFWLRSLVARPLYKKDWGLWQYFNGAKVAGIAGRVDVNVLNRKLLIDSILQK